MLLFCSTGVRISDIIRNRSLLAGKCSENIQMIQGNDKQY